MWRLLFVCLLVAGVLANTYRGSHGGNTGFEVGYQYEYDLESRTLTSLQQPSANQYTGVVIRAKVLIRGISQNAVTLQIDQPQYGKVHGELPSGWRGQLPDDISMKQLNLNRSPVEVHFKNGVVDNIRVSKNIPTYELNIIKSIVSQLQIDTQAENLKKSKWNSQSDNSDESVVTFKTMEDSVTGECETLYDISPLMKKELLNNPKLAPLVELSKDHDVNLTRVVKTKNYANCNLRSAYNFGFNHVPAGWEPGSNRMGEYLARSAITNIILSGVRQNYNIQSVHTDNEIVISPNLNERVNQKGHVVSRVNMTLNNVRQVSSSSSHSLGENVYTVHNLVYEYNPAASDESLQTAYLSAMKRQSQNDDSTGQSRTPRSLQQKRLLLAQSINANGGCISQSSSSNNSSESSPSCENISINGNSSESSGSSSSSSSSDSSESSDSSSSSSSSISSGSNSDESSSSSSSSSGSDEESYPNSNEQFWQVEPTLTRAPNVPFLPLYIANKGNSIVSAKNLNAVDISVEIAKEIGNDLQDINNLSRQNTIEKFALISYIAGTIDAKDHQKLTEQLYYPQSKVSQGSRSDAVKHQAWVAYRDAVVDAGTGPALVTIASWIKSKKVSGMEAAKLLSALPDTVKTPTNDYLDGLYNFILTPEVTNEQYLNDSAILAFTDILRRTQVNSQIYHARYAKHTFGPMASKNKYNLYKKYIPQLGKLLQQAVAEGYSPKIQVYIRALGNIGHPSILSLFEPYLEGQQKVSEFQRLLIVTSLDKLVINYPKIARAVMYRLYENTAETDTVRVAAVSLLMKTNPSVALLQRLAEFTNRDHSQQVISVVQSAIKSAAADLNGNKQNARNARAAVNLLSPREPGEQYSKSKLRNFISDEMYTVYQQYYAYIGSQDTIYPSSVLYSAKRQHGSVAMEKIDMNALLSSSDDLLAFVNNIMGDNTRGQGIKEPSNNDNSFDEVNLTPAKVAQLLNIESDRAEQVEGNVFLKLFAGKNMFGFDNNTLGMAPKLLRKLVNNLKSGESFNVTKYSNRMHTVVAFPLASGLPFFHSYNIPTLFYWGGEVQATVKPDPVSSSSSNDQINVPDNVNANAEMELTYVSRAMSRYGFTTPFDHTVHVAGIDKNLQLYAPIRSKVDVDTNNNRVQVTVQPLSTDDEKNLAHYSVQAYTSPYDIYNLRPLSEDKNKLPNIRQNPIYDKVVGKENTGFAFKLSYTSEENTLDLAQYYTSFLKHNDLGKILFPLTESNNIQKSINLVYMPGLSTANTAKFTISLDNGQDHDSSQEASGKPSKQNYKDVPERSAEDSAEDANSNNALPSNTSPDSENRRKQLLSRVSANLQDSSAYVIDVAAEFKGQTDAHIIATAAVATSPVSNTSRLLVFYSETPAQQTSHTKPAQICLAASSFLPNVPLVNFIKALNANPNSSVNAQITMGHNCESGASITIKAKLGQTYERFQYVRDEPLSKTCVKQIEEGNQLLPACRNVTAQANLLDKYSVTVTYQNVPDSWKNVTYKMYATIRDLVYPHVDENPNHSGPSNKVKLDVTFAPDLRSVNASVSTPVIAAQMNNIKLNSLVQAAAVLHPYYSASERIAQVLLNGQQSATCIVDSTEGTTFNNRSYPLKLQEGGWYVMMQHTPKQSSGLADNERAYGDVSVLVRNTGSGFKDVKLLLGQHVKIDMEPSSAALSSSSLRSRVGNWAKKSFHLIHSNPLANVQINKDAQVSETSVTKVHDSEGNTVASFYALPSGVIHLSAPEYGLQLLYDGSRVKLQANSNYKNEVRGLCGPYNGEQIDDYTTPQNCIIGDPNAFAESYALNPSNPSGSSTRYRRFSGSQGILFTTRSRSPHQYDNWSASQTTDNTICVNKNAQYGNIISEQLKQRWQRVKASSTEGGDSSSGSDSSISSSSSSDSSDSSSSTSNEFNTGHDDDNNSGNEGNVIYHPGRPRLCTNMKIYIQQQGGQTCFSAQPQTVCNSHCQATSTTKKEVSFRCVNNDEAHDLIQPVQRGRIPYKLNNYSANEKFAIKVPVSCIPRN